MNNQNGIRMKYNFRSLSAVSFSWNCNVMLLASVLVLTVEPQTWVNP